MTAKSRTSDDCKVTPYSQENLVLFAAISCVNIPLNSHCSWESKVPPPKLPPPPKKKWKPMANSPLIRPYFLEGVALGGVPQIPMNCVS